MRVAGIDRRVVATSVLGIGGAVALWTGAISTVLLGLGAGASLVSAHATLRTPNLKVKLSASTYRMGDRDYGI